MTSRWRIGLLVGCLLGALACSNNGHGGPPVSTSTHSVLERNRNPSRDGLFIEPSLTKAAAARMVFDTTFNATFPGAMFASPLYLEDGPKGKGVFFAVTTGNDVFALDETTGAVVWTKNIGPAPAASGAGCGNIMPIGIVSTPIIDAQARTIFVAGGVGDQAIARHEVHALSVDDGTERPGWPVDVSKVTFGTLAFSPPPQNQRSALSLVGGILYVAYGGHIGDCGAYHGWVVAIKASDPTKIGAWATGGTGEGIWAAGGMASDGNGVFAVTGNATAATTTHLDSEEVVRLTGMAVLDRSTNNNIYFPSTWHAMDLADADFGSSSPMYLQMPGSTPSTLVVAFAKNGHMYLLDSKNLGGMDGHVVDMSISTNGIGGLHTAPIAYPTGLGMHIAFFADDLMCPDGSHGWNIVSMLVTPGAPPKPAIAWCTTTTNRTYPIVTTTDGKNDAILWFMNGTRLGALDGDTGVRLYQETAFNCSFIQAWTAPIAVKGRIIAGGNGRLCAWSPQPAPPDAAAD